MMRTKISHADAAALIAAGFHLKTMQLSEENTIDYIFEEDLRIVNEFLQRINQGEVIAPAKDYAEIFEDLEKKAKEFGVNIWA